MRGRRHLGTAIGVLALTVAGSVPAGAASAQGSSITIAFASAQVGFIKVTPFGAIAGSLYRTLDGGVRWKLMGRNLRAMTLGFASPTDGLGLVPQGAGACQVQDLSVMTTDGGLVWNQPAKLQAEDGPMALAISGGRELVLNGSCAGDYGTLLAVAAGGKVWQKVYTFSLSPSQGKHYFSPTAVSLAFHGGTGFASLAYFPVRRSMPPLVVGYRTADAGRTWSPVTIGNHGLTGVVNGISFANASDGIAAATLPNGTATALYATDNGGRTWTRVRKQPGGVVSVSLDLVTGRVGYAALSTSKGAKTLGALLKTTDGGRTWKALASPR